MVKGVIRGFSRGFESVSLINSLSSSRNEYQEQKEKFLEIRALPARKDDDLTAICDPIVSTMWDPQYLTTP
jgi:hypothetical protein